MTKTELYNAITETGVELPPIAKLSKADLEQKFSEVFPEMPPLDALEKSDTDSAKTEEEPEKAEDANDYSVRPPIIYFANAGWCDELKKSYYIGWYQPLSWPEYNILAKYASKGE